MILSGKEISRQVNVGGILINPFNAEKCNPNSYNLTLNENLMVYTDSVLDMKRKNKVKRLSIPEKGKILYPGIIYLGRTNERTHTDKFVPMLEGRSSCGRLGLDVHISAGFGDIGFDGYWTLELRVTQPLRIYPNVDICQIIFHEIVGDFELYKNKYQNNTDIQGSKLYLDFEVKDEKVKS